MTSIKLEINADNFLKNLENIFTNKECVLSELVQNSRRANATEIHIDYDNGSLKVRDNGCGVEDIAKMFKLAESGWKSKEDESPFGFGFISTIFCCDEINVVSGHSYIAVPTADIKQGQSFVIRDTDNFVKGTVITMHNFALSEFFIRRHLENIALVAEIKVFFNGKELDAHLQTEKLLEANYIHREFEFGDLYINPDFTERHCVYVLENLQEGLSYGCSLYHNHLNYTDCNIVKLDPAKVKARMPDRQGVLNQTQIRTSIGLASSDVIKECLKKALSVADDAGTLSLLTRYDELLRGTKYRVLLNDIDSLPMSYLNPLGESYPSGEDKPRGAGVGTISRADLADLLIISDIEYDVGSSFLLPMYAHLHSAYELNVLLDSDHWVHDMVKQVDETTLSLQLQDHYKTAQVDGLDIKYCKAYLINGPLGEAASTNSAFYSDDGVIFPDQESDAEIYKQVYSYDYDQENTQALIEIGSKEFLDDILINQSDDAAFILQRALLGNIPFESLKKLANKTVSFSIDEKGALIVTKA